MTQFHLLPAMICCRLSEIIYFAAQVPGRTRTIPQVQGQKCNDIYNSEAHKTSVVKIAVIMEASVNGEYKGEILSYYLFKYPMVLILRQELFRLF